ncbi:MULTISPECIES: hypothetical protein [Citrobacter]|uniref:hypothetical protein n=1 Tax=Citrobacter TaxID=544 RepID=UPI0019005483|nr:MULTISPECIES: hypothetical protein [Citrobacter]MBJ9134408.1 hypothetical protein [Citrobacter farmeri]MDM2738407.1 hypothetical protein [Citrobacter sp. Ct235]
MKIFRKWIDHPTHNEYIFWGWEDGEELHHNKDEWTYRILLNENDIKQLPGFQIWNYSYRNIPIPHLPSLTEEEYFQLSLIADYDIDKIRQVQLQIWNGEVE